MSTSQQAYKRSTRTGIRSRLNRIRSVYDFGFSRPDDRFIPLAPIDLASLLGDDAEVFGPAASSIPEFTIAVTRVLEQEKATFERLLTQSYAPFNPDRETLDITGVTDRNVVPEDVLMAKLDHMLEKANFECLTPEQVEAAINAGNTHGMRVYLDDSRVSSMSVWVRGRSETKHRQRTWLHPFRGVETTVAVFNRLVVVASMRGDDHVQVKLFKDIPIRDVEALLPHARVKMNRRDAVMMLGGGAGAIWSVITKLTILSVAAVTNLLWVLAVPLAGLSWRLFSGYRRALKDRDSHRARHLYYQNLGSNRSAIHLIATMICEEEIKEAVLLYAFCSAGVRESLRPESLQDLDRLIQNYLHERVGIDVDFDIEDAAETMDRLGLWLDRDALAVIKWPESSVVLDRHWSERRSESYHARLLGIEA